MERRVLGEPVYRARRELARQVSARAWAIVEILLQAGLRASELCGLRLGDVTFARPGHPGLPGGARWPRAAVPALRFRAAGEAAQWPSELSSPAAPVLCAKMSETASLTSSMGLA